MQSKLRFLLSLSCAKTTTDYLTDAQGLNPVFSRSEVRKDAFRNWTNITDTLLVLPPIPTTGLTVDDVTTVAVSTRESMLHALREISEPGPSSSLSTSSATPLAPPIPEHITQPPAGAPIQLDISDSIALRQRGANFSSISSGVSSEWSESERKFEEKSEETTEDEMDEDAVLLKKPKESVA